MFVNIWNPAQGPITRSGGYSTCFIFPEVHRLYHMEVPDTPTPRLRYSSGELNLRPMLWYHVRFSVTPKPACVYEHLKPSTRTYHQEWRLVHLFYFPRAAMVIPCGGCTDTPTPRLRRSLRELNLGPMLWYHVRFSVTPKPVDVDEHLKPNTRPYH